MTPDKKAFFEYGEARNELKHSIKEAKRLAHHIFGCTYFALSKREKEVVLKPTKLDINLELFKQKRAACRAWLPMEERYCDNCLHYKSPTCTECSKWADPINWEPRKEEE